MYSRYAGYQPFVPMNNRLSRFRDEGTPGLPSPSDAFEVTTETPAPQTPAAPSPPPPTGNDGAGLERFLAGLGGGKGLFGGKGGKGLLGSKGLLGGLLGKENGIGSLLKGIRLDWDSGDILLVLILLFLSMDGDDDEILWILAVALITGF